MCTVRSGVASPRNCKVQFALRCIAPIRKSPPREPELASWLWCPNCTGELDEYDDVGKFLRCPHCALHLRGVSLAELIEAKSEHGDPNRDIW
jgi:hypothetical protein